MTHEPRPLLQELAVFLVAVLIGSPSGLATAMLLGPSLGAA
jgi:hypothetical protein